jgi:hypothetical protein
MRKIQSLLAALVITVGLSSCVVYETHTVTGNPIGTKKGVAKASAFKPNADYTMRTAAKKGNISKIGSVDTRVTVFIVPFYKTVVTGE